MADKAIGELESAYNLLGNELFVLQQGSVAKKATWQVITNMIAQLFEGIGIIKSIEEDTSQLSADGLEHTYVITMNTVEYDVETGTTTVIEIPETFEYVVKDGASIDTIELTQTSGLNKTYTISFDKTGKASIPFVVRDGNYVDTITETEEPSESDDNLTHTFTVHFADSNSTTGHVDQTFSIKDGRGISSVEESSVSDMPLRKHYTVNFNETGIDPFEFDVDSGKGIESLTMVDGSGTARDGQPHTLNVVYNDSDESFALGTFYDGDKGDQGDRGYRGVSISGITGPSQSQTDPLGKDYQIAFEADTGDTGATVPSPFTYTVHDGSNIATIAPYGVPSGLTQTYGVYLTSNATTGTANAVPDTTFDVTNGKSIVNVSFDHSSSEDFPTDAGNPGTFDYYRIDYNDGDTGTFRVWNGSNGTGSVGSVAGIQPGQPYPGYEGSTDAQNVYLIRTGAAVPTTATPGFTNQFYYCTGNGVLYICRGTSGTNSYVWQGAGLVVDSSLDTTSTNPVQNAVISAKVGTGSLNTTAQNLTDAVNEIAGITENVIANRYDATSTYSAGDYCIYSNKLYVCTSDIDTPEEFDLTHWQLKQLTTNIIGGDTLTTTATTLSGAINEHETDISGLTTKVGSSVLTTTAQDLSGAINEHETDLGQKVDKEVGKGLSTNDFTTAYKDKIGTATLTTTATDLSSAVNELDADLSKTFQFDAVTQLADNTDLNTVVNVGNYCGTVTQTFSNFPITTSCAFTLRVFRGTGLSGSNYRTQLWIRGYVDSNDMFYVRNTTNLGTSWSAWRRVALENDLSNYVLKAGDTMTGGLSLKSSVYEDNVTPTASEVLDPRYAFLDKNGNRVGYMAMDFIKSSGKQGIVLKASRTIGSDTVGNYLGLFIDSSGNISVVTASQSAWRAALGLGTQNTGALPITIGQGGTGASSATKAKENLGLGPQEQNFSVDAPITGAGQIAHFVFSDINPNSTYNGHRMTLVVKDSGLFLWDGTSSASRWSFELPLSTASGGTGQSAVTSTTTLSSVASAASDVTITAATYRQWGKVAQVRLVLKCTSAITTGGKTVATIVSGKRSNGDMALQLTKPVIASSVVMTYEGNIIVYGSVSANTEMIINGLYLLA